MIIEQQDGITATTTEGQDSSSEQQQPETLQETGGQADETEEQKPEEKRGDGIPRKVVEELREDRRVLTRQLDTNIRALNDIAQLVRSLSPQQTQPEAAQPAPPPNDPDKLGEWIVDSLQRSLGFQHEWQAERQRQSEAEQQQKVYGEVRNALAAKYGEFASENPDFWDAAKELGRVIKEERIDEGFTEDEANRYVNDLELRIAMRAAHNGQNPAAEIYRMAQKKAKFVPAKVKARNEEQAKKRAAAENARGIGSDGAVTGDSRQKLMEEWKKAPYGSKQRAELGKKLLTQ